MTTLVRRVALLGGSFDPPHVGHLLAALFVRATRSPDEVWLIPAFNHPLGKSLSPFEQRAEMCRLLCAESSGWLKTDLTEQELGGEGRTVDLLEGLTARHPGVRFTWVVGSDLLPELPRWKNVARIRELAELLVLQRTGHPAKEAFGPPLADVSSREIRRAVAGGDPGVSSWVPRVVLDYIRAHGLYRFHGKGLEHHGPLDPRHPRPRG